MNFTKEHERLFLAMAGEPVEDIKPVRIKINGQFIVLNSGKSCWKTVGHAKNALKQHYQSGYKRMESMVHRLNVDIDNNEYSRRENEIWNGFIQHLQNEGILEFVK